MQVIFSFHQRFSTTPWAWSATPPNPAPHPRLPGEVFRRSREDGLHSLPARMGRSASSVMPASVRRMAVRCCLPSSPRTGSFPFRGGGTDHQDNRQAIVKNDGSKTSLVMMDAGDFPDITEVTPEATVTLSQFRSAVSRIIFAISTDETRRILTGCLIGIFAEEVRFVCLDGYRLAMQRVYATHQLPKGRKAWHPLFLPGRLMKDLSGMTPDSDQPVTFTLSKPHFMVSFGKPGSIPLILGIHQLQADPAHLLDHRPGRPPGPAVFRGPSFARGPGRQQHSTTLH